MAYLAHMGTYREWSQFYDTAAWDDLRRATLREQGCKCAACGATDTELHVDHIRPRSRYPSLSMDPDNLQVLCRECNFAKGGRVIDYRHRHTPSRVPIQLWPSFLRTAAVVAILSWIFMITLR